MGSQWYSKEKALALMQPGQYIKQVYMNWYEIVGTAQPAEPPQEEEPDEDNIFTRQEEMIGALQEILDQQHPTPVYIPPAAPQPPVRNYLLYIGIGLGIFFLARKVEL